MVLEIIKVRGKAVSLMIGKFEGVQLWSASKGFGVLYHGLLHSIDSVEYHHQTVSKHQAEHVSVLLCHLGEVKMWVLSQTKTCSC